MKNAEFERVEASLNNAFAFREYSDKIFSRGMHFHPEIEVLFLVEGNGQCIAADAIVSFTKGDLFIFGTNVPHWFKSDNEYYESSDSLHQSRSRYIQFTDKILPAGYMTMPGCAHIKDLIQNSSKGLKWTGCDDNYIIKKLQEMQDSSGFLRLHQLYGLLDHLGRSMHRFQNIASPSYTASTNSRDTNYHRVLNYVNHNFSSDITISKLADYVGMNSASLCRYFKKKSGLSIFSYLLEVRLAYAKEQLAFTDCPISKIAYDAGFNSVPNFNTQFKKLINITPSEYRMKVK